MDADEFYEDDEPVAKIIDAFERGTKGLTGPTNGWTEHVDLPGTAVVSASPSANQPFADRP